jgi:hypothetical protein
MRNYGLLAIAFFLTLSLVFACAPTSKSSGPKPADDDNDISPSDDDISPNDDDVSPSDDDATPDDDDVSPSDDDATPDDDDASPSDDDAVPSDLLGPVPMTSLSTLEYVLLDAHSTGPTNAIVTVSVCDYRTDAVRWSAGHNVGGSAGNSSGYDASLVDLGSDGIFKILESFSSTTEPGGQQFNSIDVLDGRSGFAAVYSSGGYASTGWDWNRDQKQDLLLSFFGCTTDSFNMIDAAHGYAMLKEWDSAFDHSVGFAGGLANGFLGPVPISAIGASEYVYGDQYEAGSNATACTVEVRDAATDQVNWSHDFQLSGEYASYGFQLADLAGDGVFQVVEQPQYSDANGNTHFSVDVRDGLSGFTVVYDSGDLGACWNPNIDFDWDMNRDGKNELMIDVQPSLSSGLGPEMIEWLDGTNGYATVKKLVGPAGHSISVIGALVDGAWGPVPITKAGALEYVYIDQLTTGADPNYDVTLVVEVRDAATDRARWSKTYAANGLEYFNYSAQLADLTGNGLYQVVEVIAATNSNGEVSKSQVFVRDGARNFAPVYSAAGASAEAGWDIFRDGRQELMVDFGGDGSATSAEVIQWLDGANGFAVVKQITGPAGDSISVTGAPWTADANAARLRARRPERRLRRLLP